MLILSHLSEIPASPQIAQTMLREKLLYPLSSTFLVYNIKLAFGEAIGP